MTLVGDEPLTDVLLQVYRRQHADPLSSSRDDAQPLPISACVTGNDGTFRFDLPNGEYELRSSTGPGMNVTHTYFVIRKGAHRSDRMVIRITPGT
jgi:hypothetical protein